MASAASAGKVWLRHGCDWQLGCHYGSAVARPRLRISCCPAADRLRVGTAAAAARRGWRCGGMTERMATTAEEGRSLLSSGGAPREK